MSLANAANREFVAANRGAEIPEQGRNRRAGLIDILPLFSMRIYFSGGAEPYHRFMSRQRRP